MQDARRLLVFRAVAHAGSFSAAARELHRSQPSVSRAVASLEGELGLPLLLRGRDGPRLTDAGRALLTRADVVAGQLERARDEMAAHRRLDAGTVRLGAFPSAAEALGVDVVRRLGAERPGLRVELRETPAGLAHARVLQGELDVALSFDLEGAGGTAHPDLREVPLMREELLLCVPRDHPAARRRRIGLAELAGEPWIQAGGPGSPRLVEQACRRAGFEPRIAAHATASQTLVAAGAGVTLAPSLARIRRRPDVVFVALDERPHRDVRAVVPASPPGPAVAGVLRALAAAVRAVAGPSVIPAEPGAQDG
jgi:DNA-binding transcriptional LysR family regulator